MKKGKVRKMLVLALILFAFLTGSMVYEAFGLNIMVLGDIFQLLSDSSNFLTWLCVLLIFCEIVRKRRSYTVICVYILDIVLANKLYLNTNLSSLGKNIHSFFVEFEWQAVVFYVFLGGIAVWCLWIARKDYRESVPNDKNSDSEKISALESSEVAGNRNESVGEGDKVNYAGGTVQENTIPHNSSPITDSAEYRNTNNLFEAGDDLSMSSVSDSAPDSKPKQETDNMKKEWPSKRMQSFFMGLGIVCAGIIGTFLARNLIAEMFEWNPELSKNVESFFGILPPLVFISIGILISLLLVAIISSIKRNYASAEVRGTALTAAVLEMGIFLWIIWGGNSISSDILDRFLDTVTSNTLVAVVFVPIILFVFLDIALSIAYGLFFKQNRGAMPQWYNEAVKEFREIEGGLVKFALNLILGFVKFLLFIPDFLNQVSGVLLDEADFFPKESSNKQKSKTRKDKEENK